MAPLTGWERWSRSYTTERFETRSLSDFARGGKNFCKYLSLFMPSTIAACLKAEMSLAVAPAAAVRCLRTVQLSRIVTPSCHAQAGRALYPLSVFPEMPIVRRTSVWSLGAEVQKGLLEL
jgi:hypothetical protein